jgi:hypothetical protein
MHGQLAAATPGIAVDGGDHRFRAAGDGLPQALHLAQVHVDRRGLGDVAQVGARREHLVAARQDDAADGRVLAEGAEVFGQLLAHALVERVAHVGTVDAQAGDARFGVGKDEVVHRGLAGYRRFARRTNGSKNEDAAQNMKKFPACKA